MRNEGVRDGVDVERLSRRCVFRQSECVQAPKIYQAVKTHLGDVNVHRAVHVEKGRSEVLCEGEERGVASRRLVAPPREPQVGGDDPLGAVPVHR